MWLYGMGEGWWNGGGGLGWVCVCMWLYESGMGGGVELDARMHHNYSVGDTHTAV